MQKMVEAEKAAQGGHRRTFLEFNAVEVSEMLFGAAVSTRMCFHGIKRARAVGNLIVVLTRPGLQNADAVRGMADTQFELRQALVPGPTPVGAIGDVPALAAATSSGRTRRR
jgi:hypothetical protein